MPAYRPHFHRGLISVSVNLPQVKLSRHNSSNVSVEENDAAGFLLEITAAAHNHEDRQICRTQECSNVCRLRISDKQPLQMLSPEQFPPVVGQSEKNVEKSMSEW